MKVFIFYHFEMRYLKMSLDLKKFEVFDSLSQKTYPGDSASEKFPQKMKFDKNINMVKFS